MGENPLTWEWSKLPKLQADAAALIQEAGGREKFFAVMGVVEGGAPDHYRLPESAVERLEDAKKARISDVMPQIARTVARIAEGAAIIDDDVALLTHHRWDKNIGAVILPSQVPAILQLPIADEMRDMQARAASDSSDELEYGDQALELARRSDWVKRLQGVVETASAHCNNFAECQVPDMTPVAPPQFRR